MTSAYFDSSDFSNPIHQYMIDVNSISLIPDYWQKVIYSVKINQIVMNDNLLLGAQGFTTNTQFYSIDRKETLPANFESQRNYVQIFINLNQQIDQYNRSVFSFFDMFGLVGGVFGIFNIFGLLIVNFFAQRSFYSTVISKLYHIEHSDEGKYSGKHIHLNWLSIITIIFILIISILFLIAFLSFNAT